MFPRPAKEKEDRFCNHTTKTRSASPTKKKKKKKIAREEEEASSHAPVIAAQQLVPTITPPPPELFLVHPTPSSTMAFPWQVIKDRQQNQEREVSKSEKKKQRRRHIKKKQTLRACFMKTDDFPGCSKQQQQHLSAPFLFRLGWVRQSASFFLHRQKEIFFPTFAARELSHLLPPLGGQPLGGGRKRTHQKHRQK